MFESEIGIPENLHDKAYEPVVKLSNFAKNFAIKILEPTTNAISPSASQAIDDIITKYAINTTLLEVEEGEFFGAAPMARTDYRSQLIDLTVKALLYSVPGRCNIGYLNNIRDHNDTLWFPTLQSRLEFPKYDVVLADEVQDFNACQVYMLTKLSEAGARIVAVGDPNQSVYAFRGADSQSFNRVADVVQSGANGGIVHSLPKNYRRNRRT